MELKRNAVLADVVQPADLGLAPQQTIASALARRFGGYSHDFIVARFRELDFVIILPGWVSAETLIRRQIITLEDIRLRCHSWGLDRNARPHRTLYKAWIQLRNVPFECWTPARIASMIGGFGRFIRADETSKNASDLRAYRCWIAVDDVREIPRRLSLVLGDEVVDIPIFLESWEKAREGGGDEPPQSPKPPPNDPNGDHRRGLHEGGEESIEVLDLDGHSENSVNRAMGRRLWGAATFGSHLTEGYGGSDRYRGSTIAARRGAPPAKSGREGAPGLAAAGGGDVGSFATQGALGA